MTMKTGQGSDPFSDESAESGTESDQEEPTPEDDTGTADHKYPYVLRRDRVKDERTNEHVALLRDEYAAKETEIERAVAEEIGIDDSDLSVFDLREALYQLGTEHPDRLAEILLEWGYDAKVE